VDLGKYDPECFNRQTTRLLNRDYSATSAYFVTIRTAQFKRSFEIPELREIVVETWEALPLRFPSVTLDEFVVMPDHVHFILWLNGAVEDPPRLGEVVGAYKSLTTVKWYDHLRALGKTWPGYVWQRGYHDHIVRIAELEKTRQYIGNNPIRSSSKKRSKQPGQ